MKNMGTMARQQAGFTLVSVVIAGLIMSISFIFVSQILLQTQGIGQQQQRFAQFNDLRDQMMLTLTDECAISNSVESKENEGLACLKAGNCREGGTTQNMTLRDRKDQKVFSADSTKNRLLKSDGSECDGTSGCTHQFILTSTLKCADGSACKMPFILVEGKFSDWNAPPKDQQAPTEEKLNPKVINYNIYRFEKQVTYTRPYLNCSDVMKRGLAQTPAVQMASGIYRMDPDGAGGQCPFDVYCDLAPTSDGGGWALVGNQGLTSETLTEREPPLYQGMTGALADDLTKVLLQQSASPGKNNVRVKIDSQLSRSYVLTFSVGTDAKPAQYINQQTYCQSVDPQTIATTVGKPGAFSFLASSSAVQIGYWDQKFQCTSCDPTVMNPVCTEMPNAGCCSKTTPIVGSVWVK